MSEHPLADPGSKSSAQHVVARDYMPGGNTRTTVYVSPEPPYLLSGSSYEVTDLDGRQFIDLQNNYTALVHGHDHPAITAAGCEALRRGASFGMPTPAEVDLAMELSRRVPSAPHWRFANSGTEAVMYALRTARAFTGRREIVRFAGSFHGAYDDVLDPSPGLSRAMTSDVHVVDNANSRDFVALMRDRGDSIAAVILDFMPNRAGLIRVPKEFVELVVRETRAAKALFIADEIITFRLAPGGMQSTYGVTPDLTTLGKLIGGGLPVGAFGGRREIMAGLDPRRAKHMAHGGTFTANPVVMKMGLTALRILNTDAIDHINNLGNRLREQISHLGYQVNGEGSLLRIIGKSEQEDLWWRLYRAGVLICANGLMSVSTVMNEDVIDDIGERFKHALGRKNL